MANHEEPDERTTAFLQAMRRVCMEHNAFLFAMAGDEEIPILVSFFDNEPKDPFEVVYLTGNGVRYDLRKRVELP